MNFDEPFIAEMKETVEFKCSHCPPEHDLRQSGFTFVKSDMCTVHGKIAVLFCKEETCEKPICQKCVVQEHRTHNFVDFDDERAKRFAELMSSIESVTKRLQYRRKKALEIIKTRAKEEHAGTGKPTLVQEFQKTFQFAEFDCSVTEKAVELLSGHVSDMEHLRKGDPGIKDSAKEKKTNIGRPKISPSDLFFVLDEDTKRDSPENDTEYGSDEDFAEDLSKYQPDDTDGVCLMSEMGLWSLKNYKLLAKMRPT